MFWHVTAQAISIDVKQDIDKDLVNNINTHLSVYPAPESCIISRHFLNKVENALSNAMQGLGYYQFRIHELTPESPTSCQRWQLSLSPGERVIISSIDITLQGPGETDNVLLDSVRSFPIQPGAQLNHKTYETGKETIRNKAILNGYFDFRFITKTLNVDVEENSADITLVADTGARYQFGDITGELDEEEQHVIERMRTFQAGDDYSVEKINSFTQQLKLTGFFEQVALRPLIDLRQNNRVPLRLIVKQKPRHIVNLGAGASSDTGPRGTINWLRPRLNKDGHSLETELFASSPLQSATLNYKIPLHNPSRNFVTLQMGLKSTNDNDTRSDMFSLALKRHWALSADNWNSIAFLRYDQESFVQGEQDRLSTTLFIPGITVSRLRSEGELNPTWGDRQIVTLEGATDALLSDINLLRLSIQTRWLRSFQQHRLFWRADIGGIETNDFTQVPSSLRFFAGGDQSIRGFGYQSLAPIDEEGQLRGGKYLYTTSLEYSYELTENWRVASFIDIGNASDEMFQAPALGFGLGAHWSTIIGPVRFYLARGKSDLESTWRFHFAMGAAL